ncbi:MAG: hypothetical protein FJX25_06325 [Alphaproteobacteria bacterium]|nr:hypothetical protein [Alphaproteobacteria bacterium]
MSLDAALAEAWGDEAWDDMDGWAKISRRFPIPAETLARLYMYGRFELTPDERHALIRRGQGLSFTDKYRLYMNHIWKLYKGPLWPAEKRLSEYVVNVAHDLGYTWYHGGRGGIQVGEKILPPALTGITPRGQAREAERQHWVWISPAAHLASHYATPEFTLNGQLYRVQPEGAVTVDPRCLRLFMLWVDDPELNVDLARLVWMIQEYRCESATVLEVMAQDR